MKTHQNVPWLSVVAFLLALLSGFRVDLAAAQALVRMTEGEGESAGDRIPAAAPPTQMRLTPRVESRRPTVATGIGEEEELRPFGSNLFDGGFQGEREDGINPDYLIQPGDRVTLRIWGATTFDGLVVVDARGNIFIPDIGPIRVQGIANAGLNARIAGAIRTVFTSNVNVYTNLEGTNPILVYVTGFVEKPGAYAGVASDSLMFFLSRAGGIDEKRGSFRNVHVLRRGKSLALADMYQFILRGEIPHTQFMDGDTIVVEPRGGIVEVSGDVRNAFVFEIPDDGLSGDELLALIRPEASVSHAAVFGMRSGKPISRYLPLADFRSLVVRDGDQIAFESDHHRGSILVKVAGTHLGPSQFAIPRGSTLLQLLDHIEVNPEQSDFASVRLQRESVRKRQKQALEDSLRRLETAVLGATSSTDEEARVRLQEAKLISSFVDRAREIEPNGVLVVAKDGVISDLKLQEGDIITIPTRSSVVLVNGEVRVPQALVHAPGRRFEDYIARVGGYTDRADQDRPMVVRRNGEVVQAEGLEIRPGDELIVLPRVPVKNLQLAATLSQVVFQIALAAATVFAL